MKNKNRVSGLFLGQSNTTLHFAEGFPEDLHSFLIMWIRRGRIHNVD